MSFGTVRTRELAARGSDGVHVLLLWHLGENTLTVSVEDARAGDRFHLAVAPDRALDAFYHPFAYRHGASKTGRSRQPDRRQGIDRPVSRLSQTTNAKD